MVIMPLFMEIVRIELGHFLRTKKLTKFNLENSVRSLTILHSELLGKINKKSLLLKAY